MTFDTRKLVKTMYHNIARNFSIVQNFALLADGLAAAKIRAAKVAIAMNGRWDYVDVTLWV